MDDIVSTTYTQQASEDHFPLIDLDDRQVSQQRETRAWGRPQSSSFDLTGLEYNLPRAMNTEFTIYNDSSNDSIVPIASIDTFGPAGPAEPSGLSAAAVSDAEQHVINTSVTANPNMHNPPFDRATLAGIGRRNETYTLLPPEPDMDLDTDTDLLTEHTATALENIPEVSETDESEPGSYFSRRSNTVTAEHFTVDSNGDIRAGEETHCFFVRGLA